MNDCVFNWIQLNRTVYRKCSIVSTALKSKLNFGIISPDYKLDIINEDEDRKGSESTDNLKLKHKRSENEPHKRSEYIEQQDFSHKNSDGRALKVSTHKRKSSNIRYNLQMINNMLEEEMESESASNSVSKSKSKNSSLRGSIQKEKKS